jgi:hypothetical protein
MRRCLRVSPSHAWQAQDARYQQPGKLQSCAHEKTSTSTFTRLMLEKTADVLLQF